MEIALREVTDQLNAVLTFLSKINLDKKYKSEKETLVQNIKKSIEKCRNFGSSNKDSDGDVYNDVEAGGGDVYDDVSEKQNGDDAAGEQEYADTVVTEDQYDDTMTREPEEEYSDVQAPSPRGGNEIAQVACETLTSAAVCDFLQLKREKSLLMGAWQKRWCVLHKKVLYMYDSSKDKKQKEAFDVTGYTFEIRDDITKELKRKDRCFELRNDKLSKSYSFCATDKESLQKWRKHLSMICIIGSPRSSISNENTPAHAKKSKFQFIQTIGEKFTKSSTSANSDCGDDSFVDDSGSATYADTAAPSEEYADTVVQDTYQDTAAESSDIYEDTAVEENYEDFTTNTAPKRNLPPPPSPGPKPGKSPVLPPRDSHPRPDQFSQAPKLPVRSPTGGFPQTPTEDVGSASGTFNRKPFSPTIPDKRNLPPVPEPEVSIKVPPKPEVEEVIDYENMYLGMWDLIPDDVNELELKRGEICHVISKEYDNYGWWVAEKDHVIGLVPRDYLMEAYEM